MNSSVNVSVVPDSSNGASPRIRRLGRGLNALLGGGPSEEAGEQESEAPSHDDARSDIRVDQIDRNPFQPRKQFGDAELNELVESIRQHGVLQPLLVRPAGDRFQLIAGERRLLASRKAQLESVPCRILELDDQSVCEAAIEENLKRQDLNVLEKAEAFQDYLERFGCSIEQLAKSLSMSRPAVSNMLRLLELPETVKQYLLDGKIKEGHARSLLRLEAEQQIKVCETIAAKKLNVRATEAVVRAILSGDSSDDTPSPAPAKPQPTNHVLSLQDQLRDHLGAKVEIKLKSGDAGQIVIQFNNNTDFERILQVLRPAA